MTAEPPVHSTWIQSNVVGVATRNAGYLSNRALPEVIEMLEGKGYREELKEACPGVDSLMSGGELWAELSAEISRAEIVGNFVISSRSSALTLDNDDAHLFTYENDTLSTRSFRPQAWELLFENVDKERSCDPATFMMNFGETGLYGFPEFENVCLPNDFAEAAQRPLYFSMNLFKLDAGSVLFGDVGLVLKRQGLVDRSGILSPTDTGLFSLYCVWLYNAWFGPEYQSNFGYNPDCSQLIQSIYAMPFGDTQNFAHLVLASARYYRHSDWLLDTTVRLLGPQRCNTSQEHNISLLNAVRYWEVALASSVYFDPPTQGIDNQPSSIRFVIASIPSLFGDDTDGIALIDWCIDHSLLLVWAQGNNAHPDLTPADVWTNPSVKNRAAFDEPQSFSTRFLDPTVVANLTAILPKNISSLLQPGIDPFRRLWSRAAAARTDGSWLRSSDLRAETINHLHTDLPPETLIEPISGGVCPDTESCIGTTMTATKCICYL